MSRPPQVDLILGGGGQDGHYLAQHLLKLGHSVLVTTQSAIDGRSAGLPPGLSRVGRVDIRNTAAVTTLIDQARPTAVYNLAGLSSVAASWRYPEEAWEVNAASVERLLSSLAAANLGVRWIQASSSEMYGPGAGVQADESTPFDPQSPYARAKYHAHAACVEARNAGLVDARTAILFNHESPRRPHTFVSRIVSRSVALISLGQSDSLRLADPEAARDWGHAADHTRAISLIGAMDEPGDFVVATGEVRTVRDMAKSAFLSVGLPEWERFLILDPRERRPVQTGPHRGNAALLRQKSGWRPSWTFDRLIAEMVRADRIRTVITAV